MLLKACEYVIPVVYLYTHYLKVRKCSETAYLAVMIGHVVDFRLLGVYRIIDKADICL